MPISFFVFNAVVQQPQIPQRRFASLPSLAKGAVSRRLTASGGFSASALFKGVSRAVVRRRAEDLTISN